MLVAGNNWKPTKIYTPRTNLVIWRMTPEARRQLDSWNLRDNEGLTSGSCGAGGWRKRRIGDESLKAPGHQWMWGQGDS